MVVLNQAQADAIKAECGKTYPVGVERPMSKDEWFAIQDVFLEIEADAPYPLDDRGRMAVSINDMLY